MGKGWERKGSRIRNGQTVRRLQGSSLKSLKFIRRYNTKDEDEEEVSASEYKCQFL